MNVDDQNKLIEERKEKENLEIREAYTKLFHRESWVKLKMPFAKEWLEEYDKEWLEKNENKKNMNETFRD